MTKIQLNAETLKQEILEFNQALIDSYEVLKQLPEVKTGQTPYQVIYTIDKVQLKYFEPKKIDPSLTPLVMCYALVNRPYMLDLTPEQSLIQSLLDQGQPIYLIDWGYPDASDRFLDLDDYILYYMDACVEATLKATKTTQVGLLGVCQGGTFSLCYTALNPHKIDRLITVVTPVDFSTDDFTLSRLVKHVDVDLAVKTYGNIPGSLLNETFNALLPMRLGVLKNLQMPKNLSTASTAVRFLSMEKWIYDSPDQAGEAFRSFLKDFFQQNKLIQNTLVIGNQSIDLKRIHQPLLNIYASQDHLVPPSSSTALKGLTSSSNYQERVFNAGHIGIFVSPKHNLTLAAEIAGWMRN